MFPSFAISIVILLLAQGTYSFVYKKYYNSYITCFHIRSHVVQNQQNFQNYVYSDDASEPFSISVTMFGPSTNATRGQNRIFRSGKDRWAIIVMTRSESYSAKY